MSSLQPANVLRQLSDLTAAHALAGLPDPELLGRFIDQRDEAAFEVLVRRHGPMVWGVCVRGLGSGPDADDAFQATFLVLARKAAAVRRRDALGAWLHGVARRLIARARLSAARRRTLEREAVAAPRPQSVDDLTWGELRAALDEELARLPERGRAPLVLCYLEGLTQDEAAQRLGWSKSTLRRRLEQARRLLHGRLTCRGLALSAGLPAVLLTRPGPVSAALTASTVGAGIRFATRGVLNGTPAQAAAWTQGVLRAMALAKLRLLTATVLAAGLVAIGAGALARQALAPVVPVGESTPVAEDRPTRVDPFGDPLPADALARLGTIRFRHGDKVNYLAYLPDGKTLVAADWNGVRLWDAASGRERRRFDVPQGQSLRCATLSRDGGMLALGYSDGNTAMMKVAEGKQAWTVRVDATVLALSPDGTVLAAGDREGRIQLYRQGSVEAVTLAGHRGQIWALTFALDGRTLYSGGDDGTLRVWDPATGSEQRRLPPHDRPVGRLAVSPDGKVLASVGMDRVKQDDPRVIAWMAENRVRLWDAATGKELRSFSAPLREEDQHHDHAYGFESLAFTPDGQTLVTGGVDQAVRLWDVATGKERALVTRLANAVWAVAVSPDGKTLGTSGGDKTVRQWELASNREVLPLVAHSDAVYAAAFSPDGRMIATGGWDASLRLWEAATGRELRRFAGISRGVMDVRFTPDGRTLLSLLADRTLRFWDVATGKERHRLEPFDYGIGALALSPDGRLAAVPAYDNNVALIDLASGKRLPALVGHKAAVRSLAFAPDGRTLYSYDYDRTVIAWVLDTARPARTFAAGFADQTNCAAFSPDGRWLACGGQEKVILLYDLTTGREAARIDELPDATSQLTFSPDGRYLASGTWTGGLVNVWEVATRAECRRFRGHQGRVFALDFSPDGKSLVSGDEDTTALVWDLAGRDHPRLTRAGRQAAWTALAGGDAQKADLALWSLVADTESIPFLAERLQAVQPVDTAQLARLVADLDGEPFERRERAEADLDAVGEPAVPVLRRALERGASEEARRRIERVLKRIEGQELGLAPAHLGQLRALSILERRGDAGSRKILATLAAGAPDARLTRDARAALDRLERRPASP